MAGNGKSPILVVVQVTGGNDFMNTIIPYTESVALAAAAAPDRASLFLVDGLDHVDLRPAGLADTLTLWRAVYRLLKERDKISRGE